MPITKQLQALLLQVESNKKHERTDNHRETLYWLSQWRTLALSFATEARQHET